MLVREVIRVILLPPPASKLNGYAERWIRSVRDECLSKGIPIGQDMLRDAIHEYVGHRHFEKSSRTGKALITPCAVVKGQNPITCGFRPWAILNYYERLAV